MEKIMSVSGNKFPKHIECVNKISNKWRIRFDIGKYDENSYFYKEYTFMHKPTIEEVRSIITWYYNEKADNDIIRGFKWNNMDVWLSIENQMNYKAIYDLININEYSVFPLRLKFSQNDNDLIYTFETKEEYLDFYESQITYIKDTLQTYWDIKSNIDYTNYI